jgi:hypothetical protein
VQSVYTSITTPTTTTTTTTNLSSLTSIDTFVTLHCALVSSRTRFPLGCVNSDSSTIKRVHTKFANLCYNRPFINFGSNK